MGLYDAGRRGGSRKSRDHRTDGINVMFWLTWVLRVAVVLAIGALVVSAFTTNANKTDPINKVLKGKN